MSIGSVYLLMNDPENTMPADFAEPHPLHTAGKSPLPESDTPDPISDGRGFSPVLSAEQADVLCSDMLPAALLTELNTRFGTNLELTSDVERGLGEFIDDGCDFGDIYGYLRPWMPGTDTSERFSQLLSEIRNRGQEDSKLRSEAINSDCISNPRVSPRRVWDLFANRVLPYFAIKPHTKGWDCIPESLWAVSHSWVPPRERQNVLTTINGEAWRVPIPRETTLDTIRAQLLSLGAEYVFLDVLCLRQKDQQLPRSEILRKEWRLDVPTIGYVYHLRDEGDNRPTVIYFNGLGLDFRDGLFPDDHHHWLNRVWTLQETPRYALFGGLKDQLPRIRVRDEATWPHAISRAFLTHLKTTRDDVLHLLQALQLIKSRWYSNPIDQVACLAYLMECPTLPIYDPDMDIEMAWTLLVECLPAKTRTSLLFCNVDSKDQPGSWRPTWEQMKSANFRSPMDSTEDEHLKHLDAASHLLGYKRGSDAYYHKPCIIEGCRIDVTKRSIQIPLSQGSGFDTFTISACGESIVEEDTYLLVSVGRLEHWVVARGEGVRRINGERALEVSKVSTVTIPASRETWKEAGKGVFRQRAKATSSQLVVYR